MPNYQLLRNTSCFFIAIFVALQSLWIVRYVRKYDTDLSFLESFARTEFAALLEHVAAGWGIPALVFALLGLQMSKDKKSLDAGSAIKEAFLILGFVTMTAILYLSGSFGHEIEQLVLWKQDTFYWSHIQNCLPADKESIILFSKCVSNFREIQLRQLAADTLGVFGILICSYFCLWRTYKN